MKLAGPAFLEAFPDRVINTHPALLPAFPGMHGPRDALAAGVKVSGATLFVVDDGVDTGPIVAQVAVPVEPGDNESTLHERIKEVEREMLVRTVGEMVRRGWTVTAVGAADSGSAGSSGSSGSEDAAAAAKRKVTIP
jgi:phosphoribosylglycinamide formyltransferase-1